jgi:transposase
MMDGFRLTAKEVCSLRALHRSCRDRRLADRVKAVVLLGTGWTVTDTAEALLLEEDTVRSYRQTYQQGGLDLLLTVRYQGSEPKLNPDQIRELDQHLSTTTYLRVQDVVAYVKNTFGVVYTVAGMTDFLKRLDYVYKKPTLTPGQHPDVEIQQAFIESYQTLKESKGKDDPIYFMDGVHPRHNPVAAYGWIKRGTDKAMESNTGRSRVNINGAVDIARLKVVVEFGDAVNAQSTIALLKRLETRHRNAKTIYVYCDNARYYRSRLVQAYLLGSKIQMIFLPAYCPNLNLIERLWKYFRKQVLYNRYYEHFAEFQAACQGFFESISEHATALRRLLTENFQIITA